MIQLEPHLQDTFIHELIVALKDFDIQGICLAGSAASDELIWAEIEGGWRLMSDVEVGVVSANLNIRHEIKQRAKAIGDRYDYDVEIFLITPGRLRRGSPKNLSFRPHAPNILMYDLIAGAKWLWKERDLDCRNIPPEQLPPWEGIRLILNRMGEGAPLLLPWFYGHDVNDVQELKRWILKLLMAIGDANLIANRAYTTGYLKRLERWKNMASSVPHVNTSIIEAVSTAYLTRRGGHFHLDDYSATEIREAAVSSIRYLLDIHCDVPLHSTPFDIMQSINKWNAAFNKYPIPVRYQAPVPSADGIYDSLFSLPALIRNRLYRLAIEAVKSRVPIQVIGYGIIASALATGKDDASNSLRNNLQRYFPPSDSTTTQAQQLRKIWDATCK